MTPERYPSLDVIRGFAVMGILVMNIVSMGMPVYAYTDPTYYGGSTGADWWAWALAYVFADGKMRMLFTMLFGASTAIVTDRAAHPARAHYRRMAWLFVFGMLHAWFVWYGDILVDYALVGIALYPLRSWPPRALFLAAAALVVMGAIPELTGGMHLAALRNAAHLPGATMAARTAWADALTEMVPPHSAIAFELTHYCGGFADVFAARAPMTWRFQTEFLPSGFPETMGIAVFGMALYRTGFLTGACRVRVYWLTVAGTVLALIAYIPVVRLIVATTYDPVVMTVTNTLSLILRPFVAIGYAAALILLIHSGRLSWLAARMGAAGRAAFTNYLGTSLIVTTIFYGYGFGLFGMLSRAQLYIVVAGMWVAMLAWSKPWLDVFYYGPLEWVWRSLARVTLAPMRR